MFGINPFDPTLKVFAFVAESLAKSRTLWFGRKIIIIHHLGRMFPLQKLPRGLIVLCFNKRDNLITLIFRISMTMKNTTRKFRDILIFRCRKKNFCDIYKIYKIVTQKHWLLGTSWIMMSFFP